MNIGILISGRGSNMVALVDAVASGEIPHSRVCVVISDKPLRCRVSAKAAERGVETAVVERKGRTREEHDAEIIEELRKCGVELVCLAGYMRLLSPTFVRVVSRPDHQYSPESAAGVSRSRCPASKRLRPASR